MTVDDVADLELRSSVAQLSEDQLGTCLYSLVSMPNTRQYHNISIWLLNTHTTVSRWILFTLHNSRSVESPSMVDPQWNIWYWGSKWNLHTVCWDVVVCEWGTTSVYFGITYVCFIPSRLSVFAVEPQYRHQDLLFLKKVSFERHIQNLQKFHVGLKFKWGLQDQHWVSCERLPFEVFFSCLCVHLLGVTYANMLWPLSDHWNVQLTSPHLSGFVCFFMAAWKLNRTICAMIDNTVCHPWAVEYNTSNTTLPHHSISLDIFTLRTFNWQYNLLYLGS